MEMIVIVFVHYLLVSAPILSTSVYEELVNKSTTDEASSDTASEESKCRVSLGLNCSNLKNEFNPEYGYGTSIRG